MQTELQVTQPKPKSSPNAGCLGELAWFFSGAVLPMGSLSFYRKASLRTVGSAILFFLLFTSVIVSLSTASAGIDLFAITKEIDKVYKEGNIPEITITHGVAEVKGKQPFILLDQVDDNGDRILLAADTTGRLTEIDRLRYQQGLLLTRTELHFLNNDGRYQVIPLNDLHTTFSQDPILINSETVQQAWKVIAVLVIALIFIFLAVWNIVVRLMIIATIALILWGIVSLIRPNTGFGPIIISGLYAIVPAIYISHLFSRSEIGFPGLQTFFLMIFWVIGLIASLSSHKFFANEPPTRLWTALIGLPMIVLFIVDIFWKFPSPYGLAVLWIVTFLTGIVLGGARLFFRLQNQPSTPPQT